MPAARSKNYNDDYPRPSVTGGVGGEGGVGTKGNGGSGGLGQATQMSLDAVSRFSEIYGGTGGKGGMGYANGGNGGTGEGNVFGRRIVEGKPRQPRKLVNTLTLSAAILKLLAEEGYDTVGGLFKATDDSLRAAGFKQGQVDELQTVLEEQRS
ncbi:hypothetical protein DFH06DRAFT_1148130 [Mycena polygramma]|nr:hypothetical protein DFH06DRAFT_1148130 [Mycena polygramma]